MKSGVGEGQMVYLLRDFDRAMLEERKQFIYSIADTLNQKYGDGTVLVDIEDQYFNMEEIIAQHPILIKLAEKAIYDVGYIPISWPVRGGTDGATLSYKGLPCPNLGTGGYNPHGVYEFASLNEMEIAVDIILNIIDSLAKGITE